MFGNSRQLRRWAARVLLLWLFGVASGIANACWIEGLVHSAGQQSSALSHGDLHGEVAKECEMHAALHSGQDAADASHQARAAKLTCQTSCEMSSVSLSPAKPPMDHPPALALPSITYAAAAPTPGASSVHLLMPRRDGGVAPPVVIAFLRLAL